MKRKIDIYAGLLGCGKTTLIRRLLQTEYRERKVAVIENEIGRVNLDSLALQKTGVTIREMTGGCVCCTIRGEFTRAVDLLVEEADPDVIVIEPTGAADLAGIMEACQKAKRAELHRVVMLVNARKLARLLAVVGEFYLEQLRLASCIYLNFTEAMDPAGIQEMKRLLDGIHPGVEILDTPMEAITEQTFANISVSEGEEGACAEAGKVLAEEGKVLAEAEACAEKGASAEAGKVLAEAEACAEAGKVLAEAEACAEAGKVLAEAEASAEAGKVSAGEGRKKDGSLTVTDLNRPGMLQLPPRGEGGQTVLYTYTMQVSVPMSEMEYERLKSILADETHQNIWRAKGMVRMESGETRKIELTFGDIFQEEIPKDIFGDISEDIQQAAPEPGKETDMLGQIVLIGPFIDRGWLKKVF